MPIQVQVVTTDRVAWTGEVDEVQAPGWHGEFGLLPEHVSMLVLARPGLVTLHSGGQAERLVVGRGFAEFGEDALTLLVDLCEPAGEVDRAQAEQALAEAEKAMSELDPTGMEWADARHAADLAQARLSV
ncbi:MAG: ATP synthase F1 subunit epsilon [Myxococcota bacterium]|jgi:F-type H+-transporting ATPase subunit epsilon|nr:ATP synthase F1 subunit epsilon [Myxococcota bacterium]